MSKTNSATDQVREPSRELSTDELALVTGGAPNRQNDPAGTFQHLLQQLAQGQG